MRLAIALLLAGCTNAAQAPVDWHYWVDFRAARIETTARGTQQAFKSAPHSVVNAYAECSADYAIASLTPQEKAMADEWAQRKRNLTQAEFDALDTKIKASGLGDFSPSTLDRLAGTCPEAVPLFKQHFH
jgi:DNA-binding transcriptional regulator YbjK